MEQLDQLIRTASVEFQRKRTAPVMLIQKLVGITMTSNTRSKSETLHQYMYERACTHARLYATQATYNSVSVS